MITLYFLGPPRIEIDDRPLDLSRRKAVALLAYLTVTGQPHSRDSLAAMLWPEDDQSRAKGSLRRTLSVLNTALPGDRFEADRDIIAAKQDAALWLDVARFRRLLAEAEIAGDSESRLPFLAEAVALYQADFLAGFTLPDCPAFDEWQFFQTESLRAEQGKALQQLVDACTNRLDYDEALDYARRWLALDSLHEPAHRALIDLYARTGQRAAALRQYELCLHMLDEEFGLPPAPETTALVDRIRAGAIPTPAVSGPLAAQTEPVQPPSWLSAGPPPSGPGFPFVAREQELERLQHWLELALAGQGRIALVTGEAGSGKTALVTAFARQAEATVSDLLFAPGLCNAHTGQGDPYLPFRDILSLLLGDVETRLAQGAITSPNAQRLWQQFPAALSALFDLAPALVDTLLPRVPLERRAAAIGAAAPWPDRPVTPEITQSSLFDQVTHLLHHLSTRQPLLLLVDDAQWADTASINLLFHLSRRLSGSRILLLVTFRPNDLALGRGRDRHPLEPVINEIRRSYGDIQLDLEQAMSRRFVEALIDTEPNRLPADFRRRLYQQTQGHPLFTVELLRDMQERGDLTRDERGHWVAGPALDWQALPARVEAVIEERIARLDQPLRDTLTVASVVGETFLAQVVAQVQRAGERQVLRQLSQALAQEHRLVREQGEMQVNGHFLTGYRFSHTLFQQYLYQSLSQSERRLLHGDIAVVLEHLYQTRLEEVTVQLAHHYVEAGQPDKAIDYLLRAGDQARAVYAYREAVDFYGQALAFLKQQGAFDRAARTLMKLGLTHHLAYDFQQARQAYDEGFALWQRAGTQPAAVQPVAPHPLRLAWSNPPTLDPALAGDDSSGTIIQHLFSGLVALSPDLDVVPELAYRWEVLNNGLTYRFHLRADFTWSDGRPVTAEDFVYAWRRALAPGNHAPIVNLLADIRGAPAFHAGQVSDPANLGIRALDPATLEVELAQPAPSFLQMVTQFGACPVPRHVVAHHGPHWTAPELLVTNGPFRLKRLEPGQRLLLERNPAYPGHFSGNVQQIELLLALEERPPQNLELYAAGQLDVVSTPIPSVEMQRVRQQFAEEYLTGPMLNVQYLGLNTQTPPLGDSRVRQALAMTIDKETLVNLELLGYHFPGTGGFIPPGMPEHSPGIGLAFDPERARRLLAEAGYPAGQNFPVLEGHIGVTHHASAVFFEKAWKKYLGIDVIWRELPWKELLARIEQKPGHLYMIGWRADYPDPDNFLRVGSHLDLTGWQHPTYRQLVEQARRETDQANRTRLYRQADRILIEAAAVIPVVYGRRHLLIKPWVARLPTSAVGWYYWKDVVIEPH